METGHERTDLSVTASPTPPTRPKIGKVIDNAMLAIKKDNPRLKGILPKTFARPELSGLFA